MNDSDPSPHIDSQLSDYFRVLQSRDTGGECQAAPGSLPYILCVHRHSRFGDLVYFDSWI